MKTIDITLDPDQQKEQIEVNMNLKFWELMRQSSIKLNLKMSEFVIVTTKGPLSEDYYEHILSKYEMKEITLQRIPQETLEKEFPSYVFGYSQELRDNFLKVLKLKNN